MVAFPPQPSYEELSYGWSEQTEEPVHIVVSGWEALPLGGWAAVCGRVGCGAGGVLEG